MTDDPNTRYWIAQVRAEKKRADDNLRLAAERATEISELQKQVKGMEAERDSLQRVIDGALDDIQARMGQRYNSLIDAYAALVLRYQEAERKVAKYERQQPMPGMTA